MASVPHCGCQQPRIGRGNPRDESWLNHPGVTLRNPENVSRKVRVWKVSLRPQGKGNHCLCERGVGVLRAKGCRSLRVGVRVDKAKVLVLDIVLDTAAAKEERGHAWNRKTGSSTSFAKKPQRTANLRAGCTGFEY